MRLNLIAMALCDFYKVGHPFQYPEKTEYIYSNFTARKTRLPGMDKMVLFGLQYFCKEYLIDYFNQNFFNRPKAEVIAQYQRRMKNSIGPLASYQHIEDLHDLGYLPIRIKALKEGTAVPMRVPFLTIVNTDPKFYWVTNFIETLISAVIWQPCTSATIAMKYREVLNHYARKTGMPAEFVQWQAHDFSFRGMSSPETAITSGMAHLLSFTGTDTIPAIDALEYYYGANSDKELIGGSVAATEHSVMCAGGLEDELGTFKRLITKTYPAGIVSVVSDTWNLWDVCTKILPALKEEVLARNGKVVIRPDSGDPVNILCGDQQAVPGTPEYKGVIELLWDVFGGIQTPTGHKLLNSHIGAIYGDGITISRASEICERLAAKGFASQVVFGIGSWTYQANTRDTFGTAMKATWAVVDGQARNLYKDPITDDGTKKSATGLLQVINGERGALILREKVSPEEETQGLLTPVFENGKLLVNQTLAEIRARIAAYLRNVE